jgi:hypothetical protein
MTEARMQRQLCDVLGYSQPIEQSGFASYRWSLILSSRRNMTRHPNCALTMQHIVPDH